MARYGQMTLDNNYYTSVGNSSSTSAGGPFASQGPRIVSDIGVGLNWYLNSNVKAQFQYDYDGYTRRNLAGQSRERRPKLFLTQLQLAF